MFARLRFTTLAIALLASAGAPFLIDCTEPLSDGSGNDDGEGGTKRQEGGVTAPPRLMRFTYSKSEGRVNIHIARSVKLDSLTRVNVRVRLGTMRYGDEANLDCNKLSQATSSLVDVTGGDEAPDAKEALFTGPTVKRDMESQYYVENLIGINATSDQLAAIENGTDPIIEGCITRDGSVVARTQMNLFRAWDEASPDLIDKIEEVENGSGTAGDDTIYHSVTTYGELCQKELGENPFFPKNGDGTYGTYDCANGEYSQIVPITRDGVEVTTFPSDEKCDHPDWLRKSCQPWARVNRAINDQGTRWFMVCRKMFDNQKKEDTHFNDIAMIGHNPKTGKTCFFQNGLYGKVDGSKVTNPADPRNGDATWSLFEPHTCHSCHDNDAFVHTPWIEQLKDKQGNLLVPRIGSDPDFKVDGPYWVLGMKPTGHAMKQMLVSSQAQACMGCHRLTNGNTLSGVETGGGTWVERSVGEDDDFNNFVTNSVKNDFKASHWMPPGANESNFESTYRQTLQFLGTCKNKTNNCRYQDIPH
jgi:hypothetical protein